MPPRAVGALTCFGNAAGYVPAREPGRPLTHTPSCLALRPLPQISAWLCSSTPRSSRGQTWAWRAREYLLCRRLCIAFTALRLVYARLHDVLLGQRRDHLLLVAAGPARNSITPWGQHAKESSCMCRRSADN